MIIKKGDVLKRKLMVIVFLSVVSLSLVVSLILEEITGIFDNNDRFFPMISEKTNQLTSENYRLDETTANGREKGYHPEERTYVDTTFIEDIKVPLSVESMQNYPRQDKKNISYRLKELKNFFPHNEDKIIPISEFDIEMIRKSIVLFQISMKYSFTRKEAAKLLRRVSEKNKKNYYRALPKGYNKNRVENHLNIFISAIENGNVSAAEIRILGNEVEKVIADKKLESSEVDHILLLMSNISM